MISTNKFALVIQAKFYAIDYAKNNLTGSLRKEFNQYIIDMDLKINNEESLNKFKDAIKSYMHILRLNRIYELRLKRITFKLEIHRYAPELNKLHTNIGEIKVPNQTDINKAIEYASKSPQIRHYL